MMNKAISIQKFISVYRNEFILPFKIINLVYNITYAILLTGIRYFFQ